MTLIGPRVELTREMVVEFTPDQSLWAREDPLPRASLLMFENTVLAKDGIGNATVSKEAQDKTLVLTRDPVTGNVIKQDPLLANMGKTVMRVTEQTIVKGKGLSKENEKELKDETTVIRK